MPFPPQKPEIPREFPPSALRPRASRDATLIEIHPPSRVSPPGRSARQSEVANFRPRCVLRNSGTQDPREPSLLPNGLFPPLHQALFLFFHRGTRKSDVFRLVVLVILPLFLAQRRIIKFAFKLASDPRVFDLALLLGCCQAATTTTSIFTLSRFSIARPAQRPLSPHHHL